LIEGPGYFDFDFLSDFADVGGGGISAWKSLYTLSATYLSRMSGVGERIFWAALTKELFYLDYGLFPETGRFPDFDDSLDAGLFPQLLSILKSPFEKMLIELIL